MITCDKYIGYCVCAFFLDHLFVFTTKQRRTTSTTIDRPPFFCCVLFPQQNEIYAHINSIHREEEKKANKF